MFSPIRVRRCTVLADARPDGRLPPIDAAQIAATEARARAESRTRVGASESVVVTRGGESWKLWIPLALVPIGGLVGFGAAMLLGLKVGGKIAASALGGLALGTVGAATISLMSTLPHPQEGK